jgi:hypothetical protein
VCSGGFFGHNERKDTHMKTYLLRKWEGNSIVACFVCSDNDFPHARCVAALSLRGYGITQLYPENVSDLDHAILQAVREDMGCDEGDEWPDV